MCFITLLSFKQYLSERLNLLASLCFRNDFPANILKSEDHILSFLSLRISYVLKLNEMSFAPR